MVSLWSILMSLSVGMHPTPAPVATAAPQPSPALTFAQNTFRGNAANGFKASGFWVANPFPSLTPHFGQQPSSDNDGAQPTNPNPSPPPIVKTPTPSAPSTPSPNPVPTPTPTPSLPPSSPPPSVSPPPSNPPVPTAPSSAQSPAMEMVTLINQARAKAGLSPYSVNSTLMHLAQERAQAMVSDHYFSHNSPVYGLPLQMEQAAGIRAQGMGAENIAEAGSVSQAFSLLMASPGHRANILNSFETQVGVGVAQLPNGVAVSQLFIGPSY